MNLYWCYSCNDFNLVDKRDVNSQEVFSPIQFINTTTTQWTAASNHNEVEYLVVAGGGGGGNAYDNGGGAGAVEAWYAQVF